MAEPVYQNQPTFSGGEFSPAVSARVDLAKYATGVKTGRNFIAHPEGGASNRPGTKYVATTKTAGKHVRLEEFIFSSTQAYVLEFGEGYIRFYTQGGQLNVSSVPAWVAGSGGSPITYYAGQVFSNAGANYVCRSQVVSVGGGSENPAANPTYWRVLTGTIYEIETPYTEADLTGLGFAQSADTLYIVHHSYAPKMLQRIGATEWRMSIFPFVNGPFRPANTSAAFITESAGGWWAGQSGTFTKSNPTLAPFVSGMVGSYLELTYESPGATDSVALGGGGASTASLLGMGSWKLQTHGTWTGTIAVQRSNDGAGSWTTIQSFSSVANANFNTFGVDENDGLAAYYRVVVTAYTSGSVGVDFALDPATIHGLIQITAFTNSSTVTGLVIKPVYGGNSSISWAEGAWSTYRGYPRLVTFYQDRLAFGNSTTDPQSLWLSKTGNYVDFGTSDPLTDDDAISLTLPSRQYNELSGLVPFGQIVATTVASEWAVGAPDDSGVSPTNVSIRAQGFRGASFIPPVVIGNRMIYVQPMGTVVRDLGFEFASNGFTGDNLSLLSSHLLKGHQIIDTAYQQDPDSIIWLIREDGALLSLTYLREQQVLSWFRHDTQGTFEALASIPGDGFNEVWFCVLRGDTRYIERMVQRVESVDPVDQILMDCSIDYGGIPIQGVSAISTYSYNNQFSVPIGAVADGDLVTIRGLKTFTELNGNTYRVYGSIPIGGTYTYFFIVDPVTAAPSITRSVNTYENASPFLPNAYAYKVTSTVSGLGHLEGKAVSILADGIPISGKTVTSGQITLDVAAGVIHIGLGYTSDLETLNVEVQTQAGTAQGKKRRVSAVTTRFLNSRGGSIGPDDKHLFPIKYDTLNSVDSPKSLATGDLRTAVDSGWNTGGRVFLRQTDPLPMSVLGFVPEITLGD